MKDIDLLDILFDYMYNKGDLMYIESALIDAGVPDSQITCKLMLKLHGLLNASGFVKELNRKIENHLPGLSLNADGLMMMLKYGNYSHSLKAIEKNEKAEQNIKKSTIRLNYATMIASLSAFTGGVLLSSPVKALWRLFLSIFE
jgi:hypothetical protein